MLLTKYYDFENSNILIDDCLIHLKDYLVKQEYSKQIVNSICDISFIENNPSYYLYYPYLFNSIFDFYDDDILKKLSVAGFLYYKSILYIDDIFDNKESDDTFYKFTMSNICQEETVKLLSSLFDLNSDFWKIWNKRKFEYFKAYQLDKVSHNIKNFSDYEKLADYKSSFGKIAIDSLYILTNKRQEIEYNKTLESHKFFYVAFQILDDISDYEEDINNGQFNISRFQLEKLIKGIDKYSLNDQKKLLYIKNIATNLYHKSLLYLNKSLDLSNDLNAVKWKNELQSLYNTVIIQQLNVYGFIKYSSAINNIETENIKKNTIKNAINKAKNYISNKQEPNGCWEDFFNNAGISDVWATVFTTYMLSKNGFPKTELQKSKEFILSSNCYNQYLWAYNSEWIPDADSTSFGILALNSLNYTFKSIDLKEWYSYQNNDGGFSTYRNEQELFASLNDNKIEDVNGWLNSHFCVSSVAYLVFSELKINNQNFKNLRSYIISNLKSYSYQPYWWTSSYYSLSFLIMASSINNDDEILFLCFDILNKQLENINSIIKNEFYTGLLINALCMTEGKTLYNNSILSKLVSSLLKTQKKDGSWKGNYSLRMPSPQIINPNIEINHWKNDTKGANILVKDFNRLFTTVMCLSALNKYEVLNNGH